MSALGWAEAQKGDHGYGPADPHAPGGDSNTQLAREPSSYGGEAVPTPGGLEGRTPNPPSADTAASYGGIAVDGQAEVCQNGLSRGEPAANPGEAGETVPPSGDPTVPANVLKDEHGAVLDTLPTVAKKINALFDKAAKADEKAETYRISAGQELANARVRVDTGEAGEITWTAWCADNIKRSEGDIRKVLAIANAADPVQAAAAERQRNREAVAKHRAYVSAASGQSGVGEADGDAGVRKPTPISINTVMRDIQQLGPDAPFIVAERLIPLLSPYGCTVLAERLQERARIPASDERTSAEQVEREPAAPAKEIEPTVAGDLAGRPASTVDPADEATTVPAMICLDDWLKICRLTPADFGRNLGLKWPYSIRRYLRRDVNGRPRKDWRAPRAEIQLKIEHLTRGCVTSADWVRKWLAALRLRCRRDQVRAVTHRRRLAPTAGQSRGKAAMQFTNYAGTPLAPWLLPIIPCDATLTAGSKIAEDNLGKIPGLKYPNGWSGFPGWTATKINEKAFPAWDSWYPKDECTIGMQSRLFPGIDADVNDAWQANIVRDVAFEVFGETIVHSRSQGSPRQLLMLQARTAW
jgi:hypothetical protein